MRRLRVYGTSLHRPTLNTDTAKELRTIKKFFGAVEKMSAQSLRETKAQLQTVLSYARGEFAVLPEDLQPLFSTINDGSEESEERAESLVKQFKAIDEQEKRIARNNPFKAIIKGLEDFKEAAAGSEEQIQSLSDLSGIEAVGSAFNKVGEAMKAMGIAVGETAVDIGNVISSTAGMGLGRLKQNGQENALKVPGDIHFAAGDMFILTGLKMPQSYIDAAELKLQEAAQSWLDAHSEKRIELRCKCDDIYFREAGITVACGQMVRAVNDKLDIDREIRYTAVKRYISDGETPYRYEITLSDFLQGGGLGQIINEVKEIPHMVERETARSKEYTKRRWADVQETLEMMFDPEGDYYTEFIKPLVVMVVYYICDDLSVSY